WTTVLLRGANEADHARHWEAVNALQEDILRNAAALISAVRQNDVRELLQRFQTAQERAIGALREARQYYLQFQSAETADAMVMTVLEQNANLLQQAVDLLGAYTARESNLVAESARRLMTLSVAALVVSVLLAIALFLVLINRGIIGPAAHLAEDPERMAQGDFTQPIVSSARDELGRIALSAQHLQRELGTMLGQLLAAVARMTAASNEVAKIAERTNQAVDRQRRETDQIATA